MHFDSRAINATSGVVGEPSGQGVIENSVPPADDPCPEPWVHLLRYNPLAATGRPNLAPNRFRCLARRARSSPPGSTLGRPAPACRIKTVLFTPGVQFAKGLLPILLIYSPPLSFTSTVLSATHFVAPAPSQATDSGVLCTLDSIAASLKRLLPLATLLDCLSDKFPCNHDRREKVFGRVRPRNLPK